MSGPIDRIVDSLLKETIDSNSYLKSIHSSLQQQKSEQVPSFWRPTTVQLNDPNNFLQVLSPNPRRSKMIIDNQGPDTCLLTGVSGSSIDISNQFSILPPKFRGAYYPLLSGASLTIETQGPLYAVTVGSTLLAVIETEFDTMLGGESFGER